MLIFSHAPSPMLVLNRRRRIVKINAAMDSRMAWAQGAVGHAFDSYLEPREWSSIDGEWRHLFRAGSSTGTRTFIVPGGAHLRVHYWQELMPEGFVVWIPVGVIRTASGAGSGNGTDDPTPRQL